MAHSRKLLFRLGLALSAAALTLLAIEATLRGIGFTVGQNLQQGPNLTEGPSLAAKGETKQTSRFHPETFPLLIRAPKGVKRVFFFGGSSTQGFPYPRYAWPSFFEAALRPEDGPAQIQAVNFGVLQAAIRDLRILFEELLRRGLRPDAVVIHSGNNELYYNRVRTLDEFHRPLHRILSIFAWSRLAELIESRLPGSQVPEMPYPLHRLYPLNDDNLRLVAEAYERDLLRIVHRCQHEKIPVVITTVPLNRDYWSPSFLPPDEARSDQIPKLRELALTGEKLFQEEKLDEAAEAFQQVLAVMPEEPKSHFYMGRIMLKKDRGTVGPWDRGTQRQRSEAAANREDEIGVNPSIPEVRVLTSHTPTLPHSHTSTLSPARSHLETALRRDVLVALRPVPEILDRVRNIARRYKGQGVYLIDFDEYFLEKYGIDGRRIFIDNCHGKPETYLEMGFVTARFFAEERLLGEPPAIPNEATFERLRSTLRVTEEELNRGRTFVETWLGKNEFFKTRGELFVDEYLRDFEAYKKELKEKGMMESDR